jgi:cobalt-zinc-cadmium efflux system membrane fusion protein
MRARGRLVAILVAIALAVAVGIWFLGSPPLRAARDKPQLAGEHKDAPDGKGHDEAGPIKLSPEQQQTLGIKVESIEPRVLTAQVDVTGKIAANPGRTVVVAPRAQGRVVRVLVHLGDTVDAGATLALLDSPEATDLLGELAQAESALALAEVRLEQQRRLYQAKLRVLETAARQPSAEAALRDLNGVELGRAKQEYISALAKLELAQAEYDREGLLVERKIGARKDLVRAEKELFAARSEVSAASEGIRLSARQELAEAETAVQQARAGRDRLRDKLRLLGFTDQAIAEARKAPGQRPLIPLVAPFRATVIEQQVSEGQLLDASSVPFRLADLGTVWALLDVPETDVAALRRGQEVVVEAGRDGQMRHSGRLVHIGDVVDEATRTVKVRVEIPNPERHFKPGMFVSARIASRQAGARVLAVPKDAVFLLDEGPAVFVKEADGFVPRTVQAGPEVGGWVPVLKGLTAGDKVVTGGGFALKAQLLKSKLGDGH